MLPKHMYRVVLQSLLFDLQSVVPRIVVHLEAPAQVDLAQQQVLGAPGAPRVALTLVVNVGEVEAVAKGTTSDRGEGGVDLEPCGEDADQVGHLGAVPEQLPGTGEVWR